MNTDIFKISKDGMTPMNTKPLITHLREASLFVKAIASTVVVAFTMLILTPTVLAFQAEYKKQRSQRQTETINSASDTQLANTLQQIKENISQAHKSQSKYISDTFALKTDIDHALATGKLIVKKEAKDYVEQALKLAQLLPDIHEDVMADFDAIEAMLIDKALSPEIMDRHLEAVETYETRYSEYLALIQALKDADNDADQNAAIAALNTYLQDQQFKRSQQPFDPEHLPGQTLEADPDNLPKIKASQYTRAGLVNTPPLQVAVHGLFDYTQLEGADNPAYLIEESDEVFMTEAIADKALELSHNPVAIYNWVRNNVEWLPTWGSIQNADLTLSALRGLNRHFGSNPRSAAIRRCF